MGSFKKKKAQVKKLERSRKIIQINTSEKGYFALCDDGTVWEYDNYEDGVAAYWFPLESIPQGDFTKVKKDPKENISLKDNVEESENAPDIGSEY